MIYFIQAEGVGHIKIGFTADNDALVRLATLQTGSPVALRLLGTTGGTVDDEKNLHRRFAAHRVHGEWFKPVAELLALIDPAEVKACDGVEIAERSVTIRVLTVGRKQFTKALLGQLPDWYQCIPWKEIVSDLLELHPGPTSQHIEESVLCDFDLAPWVRGEAWGWVPDEKGGRWIVFEADGHLWKNYDCHHCGLYTEHARARSIQAAIYPLRLDLPRWRWTAGNQLFIGV